MSITTALQTTATHRDLVPAYFHRATSSWIVVGVNKTTGGAVTFADDGSLLAVHANKRDAVAHLNSK